MTVVHQADFPLNVLSIHTNLYLRKMRFGPGFQLFRVHTVSEDRIHCTPFCNEPALGGPTTVTIRTLLSLGRMRFDLWFPLLRIPTTSETRFFFTPFCYKLPLSSFEYFQPTLRLMVHHFLAGHQLL